MRSVFLVGTLLATLIWGPAAALAAAPPVLVYGKYNRFATITASQVYNLTSAGVVPDMTIDVKTRKTALLIEFCARWYSNSNLAIVRLKARVDGENAEPSTVHVIPVANFSGTGKHQLRCFQWTAPAVERGDHTVEIYNNPTGNALVYERSLTIHYR